MPTAFNTTAARQVIADALAGPGGPQLVLSVFAGVPGVTHIPARRGMFRSEPERVQIGAWRYDVLPDGRLRAGHVVNGIVLAEESLPMHAVPAHLARALSDVVNSFGSTALPLVTAALEVLETTFG